MQDENTMKDVVLQLMGTHDIQKQNLVYEIDKLVALSKAFALTGNSEMENKCQAIAETLMRVIFHYTRTINLVANQAQKV